MNTLIEVPVLKGANAVVFLPAPILGHEMGVGERTESGMLVAKLLLPKYGDKRYSWDIHNLAQIREAETFFLSCIAEGLTPYCVGPDGKTAEPMPTFEPGSGIAVFAKIIEEQKTVAMLPLKQVTGG